MRLPGECCQIQQVIETHLPHLTQPQLAGLAWWVCGTILAGSACQNAVAPALSPWGNWNNLRQYPREWLYGGGRARPCQTELDVSLCFAPLLREAPAMPQPENPIHTPLPAGESLPLRRQGAYPAHQRRGKGFAPTAPGPFLFSPLPAGEGFF